MQQWNRIDRVGFNFNEEKLEGIQHMISQHSRMFLSLGVQVQVRFTGEIWPQCILLNGVYDLGKGIKTCINNR